MAHQHPIKSGFSAESTAEDVVKGIDLKGKNAIVTGGYSGIGLETVRALVEAGAHVTVPNRDKEKALESMGELGKKVELVHLDLLDSGSIKAFTESYGKPLHILILNAGIMALPDLKRDKRGYEYQFSTNHLGHFELTLGLWVALKAANGARVVIVSSNGHQGSNVIFDDPNFEKTPYHPFVAYGQSKTANILFGVKLDQIGKEHNIRAFSLHPGIIYDTNLSRHLDEGTAATLQNMIKNRSTKSVHQGAATQVWAATSPSLDGIGGVYCVDCDIAEVEGESAAVVPGKEAKLVVKKYAVDPANADKLWELSEKLTGAHIP